jgi:SAM-dependent methyltransferase
VELFGLLADATRLRLLALLEGEPLTVAEITRVTGLPQSRASTHLGKLRSAGLLVDRREGTSTYYQLRADALAPELRATWELVRRQTDDAILQADRQRRDAVVRAREAGEWPDEVAGRMEHHESPGRTWEATARGLVGLLRLGDVLDIGSGDGVVAALMAPRARSFTCLDKSPRVVDAASDRLRAHDNVELVCGDMHELPFADASFDQVLLFHALPYADRPERVLAEACRVLRPGGDLVALTLHAHDHADVTAAFGHRNRGLRPEALRRLARRAGLSIGLCEITSRERRKPFFEVVSLYATRPAEPSPSHAREARTESRT